MTPGCCDPSGHRRMFNESTARRNAREFRKKGLDATAKRLVSVIARSGVGGAHILEIGGGVGGVGIELLRAGAGRVTNVEISPEYEGVAGDLAREPGLDARIERVVGDAAEVMPSRPPADVVVMHRVVCCYPDVERLMAVASGASGRMLALTFPLPTPRIGLGVGNLWFRLIRSPFRVFAHPPQTILRVAAEHGLRLLEDFQGFLWRGVVLRRMTEAS